jgi:hypothetical protein
MPTWGASLSPAYLFPGQNKPKPEQVPLMMPWGCFFCDCKLPYRETTLAALLGNRFRAFFERKDMSEDAQQFARDIRFEPSDIRPDWTHGFDDDAVNREYLKQAFEYTDANTLIHIKQEREWDR